MGDRTSIEWTRGDDGSAGATWNPVLGCTKVSPGCDHCYAERITERFHGKGSFAIVRRSEEKLYLPLRWRKPRRVFVNSMSDLFHDDVPYPFIARVFAVMARTPLHTYQILTKRHARMRATVGSDRFRELVTGLLGDLPAPALATMPWPLTNVWLGVSVENQQWADIRIPALLGTPAAVRWLSCEPLLGPIDLHARDDGQHHWLPDFGELYDDGSGEPVCQAHGISRCRQGCAFIDWVVVGGESGPGARPMELDWVRSLVHQCREAGVPAFVKQLGSVWARDMYVNGERVGRTDPKGGEPHYWPRVLRVREYPEVTHA